MAIFPRLSVSIASTSKASHRFLVPVALALMIALGFWNAQTHAQIVKSTTISPTNDIQFSLGFGMSWNGVTTQYDIRQVGSAGFAYDVFSLAAESSVTNAAELTPEQLSEIKLIKLRIQDELGQRLSEAMASEETQGELRQAFLVAQDEALGVMSDDQRTKFEQASSTVGIKRVGWQKYIESQRPELSLSDADMKLLEQSQSASSLSLKKELRDLLKDANRQLIDSLPNASQQRINNFQDDELFEQWLSCQLTDKNNQLSKPKGIKTLDWARILAYSKSLQTQLKLSADQTNEIKTIRSERSANDDDAIRDSNLRVADVLSQKQLKQFTYSNWSRQAAKFGTVFELAYGELGRHLKLSDAEADELYQTGKQIYSDLLEQYESATAAQAAAWRKSIDSLDADKRRQVLEMIGDSIVVD